MTCSLEACRCRESDRPGCVYWNRAAKVASATAERVNRCTLDNDKTMVTGYCARCRSVWDRRDGAPQTCDHGPMPSGVYFLPLVMPTTYFKPAPNVALVDPSPSIAPEPPASCTCHPDDNPPRPCPQRHAFSECLAAARQNTFAHTFDTLRAANIARNKEWDAGGQIDLSFRGNELAGEVGEACNIIKKLERERLGLRGSRASAEQLAEELADVVICADLLAMHAGVDLDAAVRRKFNATSEKVGLKTRLRESV